MIHRVTFGDSQKDKEKQLKLCHSTSGIEESYDNSMFNFSRTAGGLALNSTGQCEDQALLQGFHQYLKFYSLQKLTNLQTIIKSPFS